MFVLAIGSHDELWLGQYDPSDRFGSGTLVILDLFSTTSMVAPPV